MKKLKLAYWGWFLPKRFRGIILFGWFIVRPDKKDWPLSKEMTNHENIHLSQVWDIPIPVINWIIFYIWYMLEYLIKIPNCLIVGAKLYNSVSLEQEAWFNDKNENYLETRKRFAWMKYIFNVVT